MTREEAKKIIHKHQFAFASMPDEVIEAVSYLIEEEQEPMLDKIFCIAHPLSIMSTPEREHKAIMQIAEMLEPLCLPESEEI